MTLGNIAEQLKLFMADEKSKAGGQDPDCINPQEEYEVHDWAKKFDATPEQIREAIKAVGDRTADVEMYLKGIHATTNADQEARGDAAGRRP